MEHPKPPVESEHEPQINVSHIRNHLLSREQRTKLDERIVNVMQYCHDTVPEEDDAIYRKLEMYFPPSLNEWFERNQLQVREIAKSKPGDAYSDRAYLEEDTAQFETSHWLQNMITARRKLHVYDEMHIAEIAVRVIYLEASEAEKSYAELPSHIPDQHNNAA